MNIYSGFQAIVVVVLSMVSLHLAALALKDSSLSQVATLQEMIDQDWKQIRTAKPDFQRLTQNLHDIDIEFPRHDQTAALWVHHLVWPAKKAAESTTNRYKLEILLLSDADESLSATVQYAITDLKSGDLVAEISRRYSLKR